MAATVKITIIADHHGRVLAAELPDEVKAASTEKEPTGRLVPLEGQRAISIEVPREFLKLPGPSIHRFFSEVQIHWPADVQLPKVKVVKEHKKPGMVGKREALPGDKNA